MHFFMDYLIVRQIELAIDHIFIRLLERGFKVGGFHCFLRLAIKSSCRKEEVIN
jgi:hypothetical protein